jgi:hypothetical protein
MNIHKSPSQLAVVPPDEISTSMSLLEQKNAIANIHKARKERFSRESKANKNLTQMLIAFSFLYILGKKKN